MPDVLPISAGAPAPAHSAPHAIPRGPYAGDKSARTVGCVIDWFLKNDLKVHSLEARRERVRILGLFRCFRNSDGRLMGDSPTDAVIGADLVEFLNRQMGHGQWTRRRWCGTIKRPFNEAAKLGLIARSPFQAVTEKRGGRGRDLSWAEFRSLLRVASPTMRRVLLFLRWSGARPEELRTLEWPHIDFAARRIVKRLHKTVHAGTEPRPRVIQLNSHLIRLLLWIKRNHPHGGRWVFVNSFGGQWRTHAICKNIRHYREKAGLPGDVKLYGCRHAFCTEAILNGLDLATVAELAGHRSIVTTQTYLHLAGKTDHLQSAIERAVNFGGAGGLGLDVEPGEAAKLMELLQRMLRGKVPGTRG
ncbi:MAG TPA: hypothetical protein DDY78_16650 [Planctomycetales bacterium]|jgi:integrase|nr:hypothetical protein [Planctomycetales bacterium]